MYAKRPCGPVVSAKNPNAYTKEELVNLAVKKLKVTETKAKSLTKSTICKSLIAGKVVERTTPVKKRKVAVSPSPPKKKVVKKPVKAPVSPSPPKKKTVKKKVVKPDSPSPPKKKTVKVVITPIKKQKTPEPKIKVKAKKPCIEQSDLKLREHQIRVVNHIRQHRGLIVCHDVGSGKTLTAVTAAQCYIEDTKAQGKKAKIIVVTPVSLQDNFKKEMEAYGVGKSDMKKYEFHTLQKFATEYNKKPCGGDADHPVMLIIDEAHNLRSDVKRAKSAAASRLRKNPPKDKAVKQKSPVVRADVAIRCAKTADKVLLLTATSVYNEPRDLANLVAMIKGETNVLSKKDFDKLLASETAFKNYFKCAISFYEVPKGPGTEYPTVEESYVEIPMSDTYYEEYRRVEQRNSHLFSETNPWRFLTGVRQASNALEECIKCQWVLERAQTGIKMIIYSAFKSFGVEKMQEMFKEEGIKYVEITGEVKKADRMKAVKAYNSGKVNVLFITKAGGEGIDTKKTREVVIFESSWNRATESQVIGRAVRFRSHADLPPSERHVDVYHVLMVKPGVRFPGDTKESADTMLQRLTEVKELANSQFLKRLYPLSIEQMEC